MHELLRQARDIHHSLATIFSIALAVLDAVLSHFMEQNRSPHGVVVVDGQVTAAEWIQGQDSERRLVVATEHGSGLICGQGAGGEILGAPALLSRLDI